MQIQNRSRSLVKKPDEVCVCKPCLDIISRAHSAEMAQHRHDEQASVLQTIAQFRLFQMRFLLMGSLQNIFPDWEKNGWKGKRNWSPPLGIKHNSLTGDALNGCMCSTTGSIDLSIRVFGYIGWESFERIGSG
jgi:hypothetical protein